MQCLNSSSSINSMINLIKYDDELKTTYNNETKEVFSEINLTYLVVID